MPERADDLVRDLQSSRERLLAVVAGVSEEQFKRRPTLPTPVSPMMERGDEDGSGGSGPGVTSAGTWSIAEVLAHLLAMEQRAGEHIEDLMAGKDAPASRLDDEERNAEARQGRLVPVPQLIHGLLAARRRLERALTQPGVGEVPEAVVRAVRVDVIEHESEHRAQIEAVKAVLGSARVARQ